MKSRKVTLTIIITLIVIIIIGIAASIVSQRPASAMEYMQLGRDERIKYAQERYSEFTKKEGQEFEVLVSFKYIPSDDICKLLSTQDNIISAFHCFDLNGECAIGSYTQCKGKDINKVVDDYYSSVYMLVDGQIDSYADYVESLKSSHNINTDFEADERLNEVADTYGKLIDTSPIEVNDEQKKPDMTLEDELRDAEHLLNQFILQKESMENGCFYIYGIRLVMSGADVKALLSNDAVLLIEILDFDNNDLITPIK